MLKTALTSLAIAGLLVVPSTAQVVTTPTRGAPISKGVTTGDLSVQVDQARQQSADMLVAFNRLEEQVNALSGRVESLEFELGQARDTNNNLMSDNETLSREAQSMRQTLDYQSRAIAALQVVLGVEAEPAPVSDAYSGNAPTLSVTTTPASSSSGGPVQLAPAGSGLPEGSLGTLSATQLPGEAGALFAEAKARLIRLDYAGAEEAFQAFIDQFGKDKQAGEAYFWLGESLHQQQAYADAGTAYTTMIRSYPDDPRAPDGLVRLARAMRFVGETDKACTALDALPKRYPSASKVVRDLAAVERTRSGCKN